MDIQDSNLVGIMSASASRIELWQRVLMAAQPERVAEIGVWKGEFSKEILRSCASIVAYYMIDPWATLPDWNKPFNVDSEAFDEVYAEAMTNVAFASDKLTVLRGRTKEVIEQIPDESLDFAYIDGDHTLRGIAIDLIKILPKIRVGGLIGGDDFTSNPWQHDMRYEPTMVCPFSVYFAEAMDLPIVALPFNQFVIHKKVGASFSFVDHTGNYSDLSLNRLPPGRTALGAITRFKSWLR